MEGIVEALINGQSPDNYLSGNVGQITQTLNQICSCYLVTLMFPSLIRKLVYH
ncbi:Uncharacterised protein [Mannheimia haemolytica]|uniref:Uncharacterized protein n=1 Tax=Mannheimia haemolytica TaxID=75985 RepID=A0A378MXR5_MANHA|nr:Uncharacterised protein [Mannheimia haemolytica]